MSYDSYTMEGLTLRGAKTALGMITAAILNLPPELRHKTKNMFICMIPGPSQPCKSDIGHYQCLLFTTLAKAWSGIHISRTAHHSNGRLVKAFLAMDLNNLIAAQHSNGQAPSTSCYFCLVCKVPRKYDGTTFIKRWRHQLCCIDVDHPDWAPCAPLEMREVAKQYREAKSYSEHFQIYKLYGLWHSEHWIFLYWNPP